MTKRKPKELLIKDRRPLLYTEDEFKRVALRYFKGLLKSKKSATKAGLLLELDISRETYREYKERPQFVDTIRMCELLIEDEWNQLLRKSAATGPIFYLKNAFKEEYRDSHDVTTDGEKLPTPILSNVHRDDNTA